LSCARYSLSLWLFIRPVNLISNLQPQARFDEGDMLKDRIYRRCAIVGNSGLSMIYNDGPRIDAHDAVMRFNSAPTRPRKCVPSAGLLGPPCGAPPPRSHRPLSLGAASAALKGEPLARIARLPKHT
jgi:hypothetical protein